MSKGHRGSASKNEITSSFLSEAAAIDVIALTIISACVGVNAATMPDNFETAFKVLMLMIFLSFFYYTMRNFASMMAEKEFRRSVIFLSLMTPSGVLCAWTVGDFASNIFLGGALIGGWLITFLFFRLSVW